MAQVVVEPTEYGKGLLAPPMVRALSGRFLHSKSALCALSYVRAGRLTAQNGDFRRGQERSDEEAPLTPEYVAKLPPDAQKQFIGEVLYERITPDQPALAGKVCRGAWTRVTIGRL